MGSHCFAIRVTWMEMEVAEKCPLHYSCVLMQREQSTTASELRNRVTEMLSTRCGGAARADDDDRGDTLNGPPTGVMGGYHARHLHSSSCTVSETGLRTTRPLDIKRVLGTRRVPVDHSPRGSRAFTVLTNSAQSVVEDYCKQAPPKIKSEVLLQPMAVDLSLNKHRKLKWYNKVAFRASTEADAR
jgi:hypothetical protein